MSDKGDAYPVPICHGLVIDRIGKLLEQFNAVASSRNLFERLGGGWIADEKRIELRGLIFDNQSEGSFSIDSMMDHKRVIWFASVAMANDV